MNRPTAPPAYRLAKSALQSVLVALRVRGYRTIGPQCADGAIVWETLESSEQLPTGWLDDQDAGRYRLRFDPSVGTFDHVVGPHSLKNYLFPPRETLAQYHRTPDGWEETATANSRDEPLAILGVRSCDLHALAIQDRVFLEGPYQDPQYRQRRESLFLIAIQCRRAAATCFCHSMGTGPHAEAGYDWAMYERDDDYLIVAGTERGTELVQAIPEVLSATSDELADAHAVSVHLAQQMQARPFTPSRAINEMSAASSGTKSGSSNANLNSNDPSSGGRAAQAAVVDVVPRALDTRGLRELMLAHLDSPVWADVGARCVACANCTMVCPTCFCSSVHEISDLTDENVRRERSWDSCFTMEHSRVHSGVVRQTTASRYRQWATHKLATWFDQFGTSGCVGCGRCITWCPVAIDLTQEVATLRSVHA